MLPVVHGSALGEQGHSQALVTTTVGEADDQARSEGIAGQTSKQLMVQFIDRMAAAAEVSCPPHLITSLLSTELIKPSLSRVLRNQHY